MVKNACWIFILFVYCNWFEHTLCLCACTHKNLITWCFSKTHWISCLKYRNWTKTSQYNNYQCQALKIPNLSYQVQIWKTAIYLNTQHIHSYFYYVIKIYEIYFQHLIIYIFIFQSTTMFNYWIRIINYYTFLILFLSTIRCGLQ